MQRSVPGLVDAFHSIAAAQQSLLQYRENESNIDAISKLNSDNRKFRHELAEKLLREQSEQENQVKSEKQLELEAEIKKKEEELSEFRQFQDDLKVCSKRLAARIRAIDEINLSDDEDDPVKEETSSVKSIEGTEAVSHNAENLREKFAAPVSNERRFLADQARRAQAMISSDYYMRLLNISHVNQELVRLDERVSYSVKTFNHSLLEMGITEVLDPASAATSAPPPETNDGIALNEQEIFRKIRRGSIAAHVQQNIMAENSSYEAYNDQELDILMHILTEFMDRNFLNGVNGESLSDDILENCKQFTRQAVLKLNSSLREQRQLVRKRVSELQLQLRVNENELTELRNQIETADEDIKEYSKTDRTLQQLVEQQFRAPVQRLEAHLQRLEEKEAEMKELNAEGGSQVIRLRKMLEELKTNRSDTDPFLRQRAENITKGLLRNLNESDMRTQEERELLLSKRFKEWRITRDKASAAEKKLLSSVTQRDKIAEHQLKDEAHRIDTEREEYKQLADALRNEEEKLHEQIDSLEAAISEHARERRRRMTMQERRSSVRGTVEQNRRSSVVTGNVTAAATMAVETNIGSFIPHIDNDGFATKTMGQLAASRGVPAVDLSTNKAFIESLERRHYAEMAAAEQSALRSNRRKRTLHLGNNPEEKKKPKGTVFNDDDSSTSSDSSTEKNHSIKLKETKNREEKPVKLVLDPKTEALLSVTRDHSKRQERQSSVLSHMPDKAPSTITGNVTKDCMLRLQTKRMVATVTRKTASLNKTSATSNTNNGNNELFIPAVVGPSLRKSVASTLNNDAPSPISSSADERPAIPPSEMVMADGEGDEEESDEDSNHLNISKKERKSMVLLDGKGPLKHWTFSDSSDSSSQSDVSMQRPQRVISLTCTACYVVLCNQYMRKNPDVSFRIVNTRTTRQKKIIASSSPADDADESLSHSALPESMKKALQLIDDKNLLSAMKRNNRFQFNVPESVMVLKEIISTMKNAQCIDSKSVASFAEDLIMLERLEHLSSIPKEEEEARYQLHKLCCKLIETILNCAPRVLLVRNDRRLFVRILTSLMGTLGVILNCTLAFWKPPKQQKNKYFLHENIELVCAKLVELVVTQGESLYRSKNTSKSKHKKSMSVAERRRNNRAIKAAELLAEHQRKLETTPPMRFIEALCECINCLVYDPHKPNEMRGMDSDLRRSSGSNNSIGHLNDLLHQCACGGNISDHDSSSKSFTLVHRHLILAKQLFLLLALGTNNSSEFTRMDLESAVTMMQRGKEQGERLGEVLSGTEDVSPVVPHDVDDLLQQMDPRMVPAILALELFRRVMEEDFARVKFLYRIAAADRDVADLQYLNVGMPLQFDVDLHKTLQKSLGNMNPGLSGETALIDISLPSVGSMRSSAGADADEIHAPLAGDGEVLETDMLSKVRYVSFAKHNTSTSSSREVHQQWLANLKEHFIHLCKKIHEMVWQPPSPVVASLVQQARAASQIVIDPSVGSSAPSSTRIHSSVPLPENIVYRMMQHIERIRNIVERRDGNGNWKMDETQSDFCEILRELKLSRKKILRIVGAMTWPMQKKLIWSQNKLDILSERVHDVNEEVEELEKQMEKYHKDIKILQESIVQVEKDRAAPSFRKTKMLTIANYDPKVQELIEEHSIVANNRRLTLIAAKEEELTATVRQFNKEHDQLRQQAATLKDARQSLQHLNAAKKNAASSQARASSAQRQQMIESALELDSQFQEHMAAGSIVATPTKVGNAQSEHAVDGTVSKRNAPGLNDAVDNFMQTHRLSELLKQLASEEEIRAAHARQRAFQKAEQVKQRRLAAAQELQDRKVFKVSTTVPNDDNKLFHQSEAPNEGEYASIDKGVNLEPDELYKKVQEVKQSMFADYARHVAGNVGNDDDSVGELNFKFAKDGLRGAHHPAKAGSRTAIENHPKVAPVLPKFFGFADRIDGGLRELPPDSRAAALTPHIDEVPEKEKKKSFSEKPRFLVSLGGSSFSHYGSSKPEVTGDNLAAGDSEFSEDKGPDLAPVISPVPRSRVRVNSALLDGFKKRAFMDGLQRKVPFKLALCEADEDREIAEQFTPLNLQRILSSRSSSLQSSSAKKQQMPVFKSKIKRFVHVMNTSEGLVFRDSLDELDGSANNSTLLEDDSTLPPSKSDSKPIIAEELPAHLEELRKVSLFPNELQPMPMQVVIHIRERRRCDEQRIMDNAEIREDVTGVLSSKSSSGAVEELPQLEHDEMLDTSTQYEDRAEEAENFHVKLTKPYHSRNNSKRSSTGTLRFARNSKSASSEERKMSFLSGQNFKHVEPVVVKVTPSGRNYISITDDINSSRTHPTENHSLSSKRKQLPARGIGGLVSESPFGRKRKILHHGKSSSSSHPLQQSSIVEVDRASQQIDTTVLRSLADHDQMFQSPVWRDIDLFEVTADETFQSHHFNFGDDDGETEKLEAVQLNRNLGIIPSAQCDLAQLALNEKLRLTAQSTAVAEAAIAAVSTTTSKPRADGISNEYASMVPSIVIAADKAEDSKHHVVISKADENTNKTVAVRPPSFPKPSAPTQSPRKISFSATAEADETENS